MKRQQLEAILRVVICAGILLYLFSRMELHELTAVLSSAAGNWPWLVAGTAITFLGLFMGVLRWATILKLQDILPNRLQTFSIFFIGQFFNAFMLGACGGDAARAIYVARESPGKRAEAASTVFIDRALGLFTLIVFCCIMILIRIPLFLGDRGTQGIGILMLSFLVVSIVALVALFRRNLFEHWSFFKKLEDTGKVGPLIRRAYDAFYLCRKHPRAMTYSIVLSAFNLIFLTLACYCFGCSVEIDRPLIDYFTLFPIITVLAALPITPGGLGLREGLFIEMFKAVGVGAAQAFPLSLLNYLGGVIWSLFGGILFVGYSTSSGHSIREEINALKQDTYGPTHREPHARAS